MKKQHSLGSLEWSLAGWTPYIWRQQRSIESGVSLNAEVPAIPARVPGSVQGALLSAGLLPDWNVGLDARQWEWVENRHWIFTTTIPDTWLEPGRAVRLRAFGLDYSGWVLLNGKEVAPFRGSFIPHVVDLTSHLRETDNVLQIVFDCPPRWLGQIGYTSRMTDWKPRFNYFWDWTSRLVQLGIWDDLLLEVSDGNEILVFDARAEIVAGKGRVRVTGLAGGEGAAMVRVALSGAVGVMPPLEVPLDQLRRGIEWAGLDVEAWWPNGAGTHPLYTLTVELLDSAGAVVDTVERRLGFASVEWRQCGGAPAGAGPWICVVNGRSLFLQGVNWTPIRPNFADVEDDHYRHLLETYRDLGCNLLRVWGGAFLEKEIFYRLCDELGLLVWQEFPLSSSGLENRPPDDPVAIDEMAQIAESYIERRGYHVSLAIWCGGNELQDGPPVGMDNPMIARLAEVVRLRDAGRRFLPTSPSGPSFSADERDFGRGLHWDVHGPWHVKGTLDGDWRRYWEENDGLFHSEVGVAGASSASIIRAFKGELPEVPGTRENPLWRRTSWWIEWQVFAEERGREPESLEEYVAWSQERQSQALAIAAAATRARFPRCGGFLVWMGHDSFPCTANTAIIGFDGQPKPAALALKEIWRGSSNGEPGAGI